VVGVRSTLRVCSLYPDLMNIYADRGNLLVLRRRCQVRSIGFELTEAGLQEEIDPGAHDLIYLGGGQDRDQLMCAEDLTAVKGDALRAAAAAGAVLLGVCGGYQLFGRSYELGSGMRVEGVGLLEVETVREDGPRLIGNVAIETSLGRRADGERVLAGFENHGGRTRLLDGQEPLGRVLRGFGNDGRSGLEGARSGNVIGTYLHGPLLPKNAWFADWLIATALGGESSELTPLGDGLEERAHAGAIRAAGLQTDRVAVGGGWRLRSDRWARCRVLPK
jgi:lipid II isoglutaminyl synthase (glutamine-hydrolysing)